MNYDGNSIAEKIYHFIFGEKEVIAHHVGTLHTPTKKKKKVIRMYAWFEIGLVDIIWPLALLLNPFLRFCHWAPWEWPR